MARREGQWSIKVHGGREGEGEGEGGKGGGQRGVMDGREGRIDNRGRPERVGQEEREEERD